MSASYVPARWPAPLATAFVWALAAASAVFWGLKLSGPPDAPAPPAVAASRVAVDSSDVAKGLGAISAQVTLAPEAASRFVLLGVIADDDQLGAALIAVDGKPARPFRVGQTISDGYVLQSVNRRTAALGPRLGATASLTLQLPKPAAATAGAGMAGASPLPSPRVPSFAPGIAPNAMPINGPAMMPQPGIAPVMPVMPAAPQMPDGGSVGTGG